MFANTLTKTMNELKTKILIVDDVPANVELLQAIFEQDGYEIFTAPGGASALRLVQTITPDIILMDVHMPDHDGYEVCEQIKTNEALADIPVIFLSAMDKVINKVRAFQAGGVDYITKPFEVAEVLARVKTQLAIYNQRREIEALREKDQRYAKALSNFIQETMKHASHDLRNPLSGINIAVHLLEAHGTLDDEKGKQYIQNIRHDVKRITKLIEELITVSDLDEDNFTD